MKKVLSLLLAVLLLCPLLLGGCGQKKDASGRYPPSLPLARIHKLKIGYILRTNTRNI